MERHPVRLLVSGIAVVVLISAGWSSLVAQQAAKPAAQAPGKPVRVTPAVKPGRAMPFVPPRAETPAVLQVKMGGVDGADQWLTQLPLDVAMTLTFRWKSDDPAVKSARWEVSASPFPPAAAAYAGRRRWSRTGPPARC